MNGERDERGSEPPAGNPEDDPQEDSPDPEPGSSPGPLGNPAEDEEALSQRQQDE